MMPGDEKVVGRPVYALLSKPPKLEDPSRRRTGTPATVAGQWDVRLEFVHGPPDHTRGAGAGWREADGNPSRASSSRGDLSGIGGGQHGALPQFAPGARDAPGLRFQRRVNGDQMTGTVNLGEYGTTAFTAQRHNIRRRAGGGTGNPTT